MDETSAFADLVASLRSAAEITKAMMNIGDASRMHANLFELMREIMSAQSSALVSQSAYHELLENKRGVEEEIAKLKAWNMEKYRYELQSVGPGAVAYVPKQSMRGTEPVHWICAHCFQSGKKRFLNESHSDLHFVYHKCQECSGKVRVRRTSSFASVDGAATSRQEGPRIVQHEEIRRAESVAVELVLPEGAGRAGAQSQDGSGPV
jgi:Zn finger protein HypA/HybF involved in hydrogenase expression